MRFMYKRGEDEDLQTSLNVVQDTLNSGCFMFIDLIFWALFLTIFTTPAHHSIKFAILIFISYYLVGACLFLLLKYLIKD